MGRNPDLRAKLDVIRLQLVDLYRRNLVKINHSVIELLCSSSLIAKGYDVKAEHVLGQNLVCDVYGEKGDGTIIVEIETGFVPPSHALDPARYCHSRIISKTARFSPYSNRFVLGTTVSNVMPIPVIFLNPPRFRSDRDLQSAKAVCDVYYNNPPITIDQLRYAELHSIFVIDVDHGSIRETSPDVYYSETRDRQLTF